MVHSNRGICFCMPIGIPINREVLIMGDVISIKTKQKKEPPSDAQKIMLLKRVLQAAAKYIEFADSKGVYKDFKTSGKDVVAFLDSLQGL